MKIIVTVLTYYPKTDGVQMVTEHLAEGLAMRGHDVTVLTNKFENDIRNESYNRVKIVRFFTKSKFCINYGEKKEFQKYLLEHDDESMVLITVNADTVFAEWTYPLMKQLKCKKIMYQHGMRVEKIQWKQFHSRRMLIKSLIATPIRRLFYRRYWKQIMQYNVCIHLFEDDSSYRYFKRCGFVNNVVITNGCDELFFEDVQDTKVKDKYCIEKPYFIYVANYAIHKNQIRAVECYYNSSYTDMELVLIGSKENSYTETLREKEKLLYQKTGENGKVHILTGISREETIELIKNSYACLVTSETEHLPVNILEAMAAGKPFISTNVGAVSKLPGGNICVEDNEIVYWMKYYKNHPLYVKDMGAIAREFAINNCRQEEKVRQLENIILNV